MLAQQIIRRIVLLSAVGVLSGCSLAPGMYIDEERDTGFSIIPITAEVTVEQARRQERTAAAREPAALRRDLADYKYRVGPRDVLTVTVWDHPELTIPAGEFRSAEAAGHVVNHDGTIFFPYVGVMQVAGKTIDQIRVQLAKRLAVYIKNPQLDVRVAAFRSQKVHVIGEVKTPSILPVTDIPLTALQAINMVGGVTPEADLQRVSVTRNGSVESLDVRALYDQGDVSQNLLLQDGDVLHVPDRSGNQVFVLGEVSKPASYLMHKGRMTLAEVLGEAQGFDKLTADPSRIYVIRGRAGQPSIYRLNAASPDALLLATHFPLQPQDVVFVSSTEISRWNRVMLQILPTVQGLSELKDLTD